jgi:hypothetical protein
MISSLMLTCSAWIDGSCLLACRESEDLWDELDVDGTANHGGLQGF